MNYQSTDEELDQIDQLELLYENGFGQVFKVHSEVLLVRAKGSYIPIEDFKDLFCQVGEIIRVSSFGKLIFDKRNLKVFHQPSMVWYFVEWKEEMFELGLKIHRKILPKDPVFRECVNLGRENLIKAYPSSKFHEMDIQYRHTVNEAIEG